jgi:protein-S-isoprenylcysteine O-methyltransferase Ste14
MFFVLVYRKRIAAEEDMLVASFGEKYMQCQKKLYRVIPFIW